MSQSVKVDFQRTTKTPETTENAGYSTHGVFDIIDRTKVLTYFDNELKDKVRIIFDGKRLKIKTKTTLQFEQGKRLEIRYKTTEGAIILVTETRELVWNDETLKMDYSLYHFDNKVGDYKIQIDLYKND